MKQFKPLRLKRNAQPTYTCDIAAGSIHPGGETVLHRVTASLEDHWNYRGSRFCRETRGGSADSGNRGHLVANQITRQVRQSIILPFRPAIRDRHVLALDVVGIAQALLKRAYVVRPQVERLAAKKPDHRHGRLLRVHRERPGGCRAEQRDEGPSFYARHVSLPPPCGGT